MQPATYNAIVYQGTDWELPLLATLDGDPLNSTGATFDAHIRRQPGGALVEDIDVEVVDASITSLVLRLDNEATASLSHINRYQYDLRRTVSGTIDVLVRGAVTVLPRITQ
jgi:hypothetical protein